MLKHHVSIFVTFHSSDIKAATRKIAELRALFPERTFVNRHTLANDGEVSSAIAIATVTVILETSKTHKSPQVRHDVEASLAKCPPNEILRIRLSDEEMPPELELPKIIVKSGGDVVNPEPEKIVDAFKRLDILAKEEPKLKQAIKIGASARRKCGR